MKRVYTRIGKDSDVYTYTTGAGEYCCMLGPKNKGAFINNASPVTCLKFLMRLKYQNLKVPTAMIEHLKSEIRVMALKDQK